MLPAVRTGDDFLSPMDFIVVAAMRRHLRPMKKRERDAWIAGLRADLALWASLSAVTPIRGPSVEFAGLAEAVAMLDRLQPLILGAL